VYTAAELPTTNPRTILRHTISRVIETRFNVTDDLYQSVRDGDQTFCPRAVTVRINLDSHQYAVALSGPAYDPSGQWGDQCSTSFAGTDWLDARTDHRDQLIVDAIVACLDVHGLVQK
jgi:hypothetical protein